jgi:hypothetical protein
MTPTSILPLGKGKEASGRLKLSPPGEGVGVSQAGRRASRSLRSRGISAIFFSSRSSQ